MSVKVKINKAIGGHTKGATITVTEGVAEHLRAAGVIDDKPTQTRGKKTADDTQGGTPTA